MKIHEYNEMMAYLTRPSYVSGGRVGFKRGSGNPISITDSILGKFDNLIKNTDLTLKEIGRKFNYAADLRSDSFIVKEYEKKFGKIPEQRFKAYRLTADSPQVVEGIKLFEEGMSKKAIARKFGIDRKALRNYFHQFKPEYIGEENISKGGKYNWKKVRDKRMRSLITELKTQPGGKEIFNQMKSKLDGIWSKNDEILKMTDDQIWNNKDFKKAMNLDVKDLTIGKGLKFDRYADLTKSEFVDKVRALAKKREFFQPEHFIPIKNKNVASLHPDNIHMAVGKVGGQMEELKKHVKNKGKYSSEVVKFLESQGIPITKAPGPIKKALGKLFTTATSPLGAAGFAGTTIKSNIEAGKNVADAVVDPMVGAELLYPELAKKSLAKFSPTLGKILGLGKLGAKFTPVGQYLTLAGLSKEASKAIIEEANRVDQIQDVDEQMAEQDRLVRGIKGYNQGGRVGYAKGPKDPSKRLFIKGVAAASMIPILGKYFKLAKPAAKAAAQYTGPVIEKIKGFEWVQFLAKRLWDEGADVTKKAATMDGQVVRRGTLESGDEVDMIYDTRSGDVSFEVSGKDMQTTSGAYNDPYAMDYKAGEVIEETGKKTKPKIEVGEATPRQVGPEDVELEGEMFDVDSAVSDLTELEAFAKKKLTKEVHKTKGTKPKNTSPDFDGPEPDLDDFDID